MDMVAEANEDNRPVTMEQNPPVVQDDRNEYWNPDHIQDERHAIETMEDPWINDTYLNWMNQILTAYDHLEG